MTFSIFIHLKLQHLFLRNVIRNHTLSRTLCCKLCQMPVLGAFANVILLQNINQLWKCWCDVYALLILNTLNSLVEHLLNNTCKVFPDLSFWRLMQIHEYRNKWSLTIGCHKRDDLILDHLYTAIDFFLHPKLCDCIDFFFI